MNRNDLPNLLSDLKDRLEAVRFEIQQQYSGFNVPDECDSYWYADVEIVKLSVKRDTLKRKIDIVERLLRSTT